VQSATAQPRFQSALPIQRHANGKAFRLPPNLAGFGRGDGQRLPDAVRHKMELALGADFSDVRIHVGPDAHAIGARAFTHGANLYFAPGQYDPHGPRGQQLLGHELTHVVQQRAGRVRNPFGSGVAIVQDQALEAEAERMGRRAAAQRVDAHLRTRLGAARVSGRVGSTIQGDFLDVFHNDRKVGVEITEETTGNNRISALGANVTWTALGAPAKAALWTHPLNLPDHTGAAHVWFAADWSTMQTYFDPVLNGHKEKWMKWNDVVMTEDYDEFEWIVVHPTAPRPVSHYRQRLTDVNTSRTAMRTAIGALGFNPVLISRTVAAAAGDVFLISLNGAADAVSSQITIEVTDRSTALNGFKEGLTFGLDRSELGPDRSAFMSAGSDVSSTITAAAARMNLPNVAKELLAAYLVADLCHKIATAMTGMAWAGDVASNFKGWRLFFPKSHPYQVLLMSVDGNPTTATISRIKQQLLVARTPIIGDCKSLFIRKLLQKRPQLLWNTGRALPVLATTARNNIVLDRAFGGPATNAPARIADLDIVLDAHTANFLVTAYNETVDALTDSTTTAAVGVVRSGGFAQHAANQKAFAFEDRAEVADTFPNLTHTYDRIVKIVDRY
jgi:hypothetical protein